MKQAGKIIYEKWEDAITKLDTDSIAHLIKEYPALINQGIIHYRGNGTTFQTLPLNLVNQSKEASKLLIDAGADPNEYGDGNVLALHNASPNVTQYLISKGAEVNKIGYEECTPLMYEVYMHNHENVKLLLDNGANVNYQRSSDGYSSLHWAARKGDLKLVKLLVAYGAKTETVNHKGQKAVSLAIECKYPEIEVYLQSLDSQD